MGLSSPIYIIHLEFWAVKHSTGNMRLTRYSLRLIIINSEQIIDISIKQNIHGM